MSECIIIPARYESTRFPGKPLAKINGKEMILHVVERCCQALPKKDVYIATDNLKIADCCTGEGCQVLMTPKCETGMIRAAEAAKYLDYEIIVNVQGDEPLVDPEDIRNVIKLKKKYPDTAINCYGIVHTEHEDINNPNTIKVLILNNRLLYMSRSPIPYNSKGWYSKQICIYAFYRTQLLSLYENRYSIKKMSYEDCEGIDILRCVEHDKPVYMHRITNIYQSVDIPEDISKVEKILNEK